MSHISQQTVYTLPVKEKNLTVAYVLWLFFGVFGVHQFYLGNTGRGLLYLFTAAGFGIMLIVDLFTLPSQHRQVLAHRRIGVA